MIVEFRVPGDIPSRLSSFHRVPSQRKNQALTPISLLYCGKSAGSFNRRLFSGELEGLHERSEHCLSVWGGGGHRAQSVEGSVALPEHTSEAAHPLEPNFTNRKSFLCFTLVEKYVEKQLFLKEGKMFSIFFFFFYLMSSYLQVSNRISTVL